MVSNQTGNKRRGVRARGGKQFTNKRQPIRIPRNSAPSISPPNLLSSVPVLQIPNNPGYVDFNDPTPPPIPPPQSVLSHSATKPNTKSQEKNRRNISQIQGFNNPNRNSIARNGNRMQPQSFDMRGSRPSRSPHLNSNRFNPRQMVPPMMPPCLSVPPMMPPRGLQMRLGRNGPMPILPPLPPLIPCSNGMFPGPPLNRPNVNERNKSNKNGKRSNSATNAIGSKNSKISKRTLKEIINQFPLDKPWVTDEIRSEKKKKEDIENKLKGKKDDDLFAEFKQQRDKFVTMYEAARLEYIGKHKEQDIEKIMNESDKEKGENSNKNENLKAK